MARRAIVARAIRDGERDANATSGVHARDITVRLSSNAAEAAKCLADASVVAVVLLDQPRDAAAVRVSADTRRPGLPMLELAAHENTQELLLQLRAILKGASANADTGGNAT